MTYNANVRSKNNEKRFSCLQACIDDDLDMVEFLVEQGADINRGDNEGWTPLHATASCGFISIAKSVPVYTQQILPDSHILTCRVKIACPRGS